MLNQVSTQHSENIPRNSARTTTVKPVKRLRRPKPETILKLSQQAAARSSQACADNIETTNDRHWLAENDREHYRAPLVDRHAQSYNSTGNTDSDNRGRVNDSWYGEQITKTCKNEHYWGNISDYSTDQSRDSSNPNCLRAGPSYIAHNPARDFYRPNEHLNRFTATGLPRHQRRSTYPQQVNNVYPPTSEAATQHPRAPLRTPERQPSQLTYGQQVRAANRRRLRIQDDYWQAAHSKKDCYTYGHYRRDHINSPNNIHTSVTYISPRRHCESSAAYISPKTRIENRINAISSELEDLRLELRALRNTECNPQDNITAERRTHLRW